MHDIVISPSILAADFARLGAEVADVAPAVEWVHVDVMDGHYVPNITLGNPVVASLRAATDLVLDLHLMITDPATYAPQLVERGADSITFHPEVTDDPRALVDRLHEMGARVGVAIKPDHPLSSVVELVPHVDLVLVMTVEPGFGGQSFRADVLPKLVEAAEFRDEHDLSFRLEVDGGIDPETAVAVARAGADTLVAGSAVFGHDDRTAAVGAIRAAAQRGRGVEGGG
ncbi:ribulose-phosphate 3-epimerase [Nitriliruptoria bacterium AS10]|nr:ribulose-phosphate 3-epimerase [Salsipaludibacter albus]MBY5163770.1 ribulose-phosphate 3-epimerase [Salsipaludibacter albus]